MMVVALVLGECTAFLKDEIMNAVLVLIIVTVCIICIKKRKYAVLAICAVSVFISGFCICNNQRKIYMKYDKLQSTFESKDFCVTGNVIQIQKKKYNNEVLLSCHDGIVLLSLKCASDIKYGSRIEAYGEIVPMGEADNPGNFDEREYLHSMGVVLKINVSDYSLKSNINDYNQVEQYLYMAKQRANNILNIICDEEERGIISAVALGDKNGIDERTKDIYSLNNISHIMSVSGLHISAVGVGIYKMLRKKMRYVSSAAFSSSVMILYLLFTGCSVSATRAVVMFILRLIADVMGRRYDMISAVSFSAMLLLFDNPFYVTNSSFVLSFGAMVAVSTVCPVVQRFFAVKSSFLKLLIFNMSITFTMLPINSNLFYRISTYAPLLNLIVVPFMGCVLVICISGIFIGGFCPGIGEIIIGSAVYILRFYTKLGEISLKLPYASVVTGKLDFWRTLLYYTIFACTLLFMYKSAKIKNYLRPLWRYFIPGILCTLLIVLVYGDKNHHFVISFLDIGQGEATYVHSESGYNYLIDGGSGDEKNVGKNKIESFLECRDVDTLQYVFISHFDNDHVSGIIEILERKRINVDNIVISNVIQNEGNENYDKIISLAIENGIRIINFKQGDILNDTEISITCLSPEKDKDYGNINDNSMALHIESPIMSVWLLGDISVSVEKDIVNYALDNSINSDNKLSIFKAVHHGSGKSNSSEILKMAKPDIVVISCGRNNSYGHPHEDALKRINEMCRDVRITYEKGAIIISSQ